MCFPMNIANFLRTAFFIELVAASEFHFSVELFSEIS